MPSRGGRKKSSGKLELNSNQRQMRSRVNSFSSEKLTNIQQEDIDQISKLIEKSGGEKEVAAFTNILNLVQTYLCKSVHLIGSVSDQVTGVSQRVFENEKIILAQTKEIESLKSQILINEAELCSNQLIMKGLEVHPEARPSKKENEGFGPVENHDQTEEQLEALFKKLEINDNKHMQIINAVRFIPKKPLKPGQYPLVKVSLISPRGKQILFGALAKHKLGKINVEDVFPKSLEKTRKKLESHGWSLRNADEEVRTRIFFDKDKGKMYLGVKKKTDKFFEKKTINEIEDEDKENTEEESESDEEEDIQSPEHKRAKK